MSRDTSGTRQIADFLKEVSELVPAEVYPSIQLILAQMDVEVRLAALCGGPDLLAVVRHAQLRD